MSTVPRNDEGAPLPRLPWPLLALCPLPATLIGGFVAQRAGVPLSAFASNAAACVLGIGIVGLATRCPPRLRDRVALALAVFATALVVRTLMKPGLEGVHRWLPMGPLRLHASMAMAPWLALALVRTSRHGDVAGLRIALSLVVVMQIAHLAQPDAQQATALAISFAPLLLLDATSPRLARLVWAIAAVLAALTWRRPDPLAPLPHVEQILGLALAQGTLPFAIAAASLLLVLAPFVLLASEAGPRRTIAVAGALWLGAQVLTTAFGAFPVPVLGAGAAGVLGAAVWLASVANAPRESLAAPNTPPTNTGAAPRDES